MERRQFIGLASASVAASLLSSASAPVPWREPRRSARALDLVIFDERYPDAQRFAAEMVGAGVPAFALESEAVSLWHERVLATLDQRRPCIATLTTWSDFQILSMLAAREGLRLRHLVRHVRPGPKPGTLFSSLLG